MKSYTLNNYGKKEKLQLNETTEPTIKDNDVLVQVFAAGVNILDAKIRNGEFKIFLPYKTPFTLGHDVAGIVIKIGSKVSKFKVGDEIYARPSDHRIGTFSEYISIDEKDVALKPKTLSMEEASSIPLVGLTAWQALIEKGNIKRGQKVFIQAGSGGVGTFAIQLAKHLGATVATTASSANIDLVKNLGADIVIDYKKEDFEKY
jgi:NADPH:quinone reductase-like Zn-dependent oxidoreductase